MPVTVHMPTALAEYMGESVVNVNASSIQGLIDELERRFPGVGQMLYDETGDIRRFVNIFVNGLNISSRNGKRTRLKRGDTVHIFSSIAGGG